MTRSVRCGRRLLPLLTTVVLAACAAEAPDLAASTYTITYSVRLLPDSGAADVTLTVQQSEGLLRALDFAAPKSRYAEFESASGSLTWGDGRLRWEPAADGDSLRYRATVDRRRNGVYDARLTRDWGVIRLDRLVPPARTRARKGAHAEAFITFTGPAGWRVETPYGPLNETIHPIPAEKRLFPRPEGWAVAGNMGVRRDVIDGRPVAVAAPVDQGFRRQDTLAFLRWTLPDLIEVFPSFPPRLLIVGGGRDMWRGGLSGPRSLYMHPSRPLISGNGTSTLIHELIHVATSSALVGSDDWLVEGVAEYYSLEILRRSGGISEERFAGALADLADWAHREGGAFRDPSTGADTAFVVGRLHELAVRLESRDSSLDDLVRTLLRSGEFTGQALQDWLDSRGFADAPILEHLPTPKAVPTSETGL